ncbi:hypothetical protein WMY93_003571 [Mugilogobius chulae]|uniref:FAD-dependent oxidoreductase domain-containing protein 2 n=1 Tax=Mugilogobius chulae TaxID=88201 RepID=A0AAW0PYK9_9GOBI
MDPSLSFLLCVLVGFITCSPQHLNSTHHLDYCVLGAGPSGLQMGHFLSRAKRDYIILERNSGPGSFFNKYPRHRKLISINKIHTGSNNREFNLRHDWNSLLSDKPDLLFRRVSSEFYPPADAFPLYLSLYERELRLRVRYGVDIGNIRALPSGNEKQYVLTDQHGSLYFCRVLLLATGLWVPQMIEFAGSDLVEGYESISTNPEDYKNQAVLILGKGNSAFETAQSLLGSASRVHMVSRSPVRLAWQTHYVGDLRAVNNEVLDTYQLKSLDGLVESRLEEIAITKRTEEGRLRPKHGRKKEKLYLTLNKFIQNGSSSSNPKTEELSGFHIDNFSMRKPYDRVIRCLGFKFNFSIFDRTACPPKSENARGRLPAVTAWYTVKAVHRILEHRYHRSLWPSTKLSSTELMPWILKRVNEASGPYQMFQVLGDIVLLQGSHCTYLEEFPLQALPQFFSLSGHKVTNGLIILVMQYGKKKIDYLGRNRAETDWTRAWKSNFLHPVLYYYDKLPTEEEMKLRPHGWPLPRPKAVHHMIEDFLTEWDAPISHVQPLQRFLEHCIQTDLRHFYAEACFRLSLTHRKPPLSCQNGYLKGQGLPQNGKNGHKAYNTVMTSPEIFEDNPPQNSFGFSNYLTRAELPISTGIKHEL